MPPRARASAMRRSDALVAGAAGDPMDFSASPHWGLTPRCRPLWKAAANCLFISGGYSERSLEFHFPLDLLPYERVSAGGWLPQCDPPYEKG